MSADRKFTFEELKALSGKDDLHLLVGGKGGCWMAVLRVSLADLCLLRSLCRRTVYRRGEKCTGKK